MTVTLIVIAATGSLGLRSCPKCCNDDDNEDDICDDDCSDFDCDDSDWDCDCSHRFIGTQKLSEMLQQPYDLFKPGWADHYILGMVNQVNIWMGHTRNQA